MALLTCQLPMFGYLWMKAVYWLNPAERNKIKCTSEKTVTATLDPKMNART